MNDTQILILCAGVFTCCSASFAFGIMTGYRQAQKDQMRRLARMQPQTQEANQ